MSKPTPNPITRLAPATATVEELDALTVAGLRQFLADAQVDAPARLAKPRLRDLAVVYIAARDSRDAVRAGLAAAAAIPAPPEPEVDTPDDTAPDPYADRKAALDAEPAETPGMELEPAATSVVPLPSKWQQIMAIAETVAMANLAPKDLRGKGNVANAALVLLAANDLGIPLTQAIQKLAPVNGRLVMSAELMVALVRRDGHRIAVNASDWSGCTVTGERSDTGETMSVSFTLDDAQMAELISGLDENGHPVALSSDGKALPWQLYPGDLCYARAISRLCRRLFPDSLGGISYTPEELGDVAEYDAPIGGSGDGAKPTGAEPANLSVDELRADLMARGRALSAESRAAITTERVRRNLPEIGKAGVGPLRTLRQLIEQAEAAEREAAPAESQVLDDESEADAKVAVDDSHDTITDAELVPDTVPEGDLTADPTGFLADQLGAEAVDELPPGPAHPNATAERCECGEMAGTIRTRIDGTLECDECPM